MPLFPSLRRNVQNSEIDQAPLGRSLVRFAGRHSLLNLIGQAVEVLVQPVIHLAFGLVGCKVADQRGLGGILPELFE